ncbi:MAG: hypothetical protein M3014_09305 [Chloroflexota bacterium]|nr:hypothetical protein [Chloroflexota bacterium]
MLERSSGYNDLQVAWGMARVAGQQLWAWLAGRSSWNYGQRWLPRKNGSPTTRQDHQSIIDCTQALFS